MMNTVSASRFIAGHLLRHHWRATVVLGVGLGLAAAIPVTAWGVARRTDRAFRAYALQGTEGLRGVGFCPGATFDGCEGYDPVAEQQQIAAWPEIAATSRTAAVIASVSSVARPVPGRIITEGYYDQLLLIDGEVITSSGRARLVAGWLPRADAPDEVLANEPFLRKRHVKVGDTISLGLYAATEYDQAGEEADPPARSPREVRVVGALRGPNDLQSQAAAGGIYTLADHLLLGPGLLHAFDDDVATYGILIGVVPRDGSVDVEALLAERFTTRPVDVRGLGGDEGDQLDAIGRSVHLQANGARALAVTTALAAIVFGGQALTRQLRRELAMRATLSALGMRESDVRRVVVLRAAPVAAIATVTCVGAAWLGSPIGPVGIARKAELHPGLRGDWPVLGVGALGVVAALGLMTVLAMRAPTVHETARSRWTSLAASISAPACSGLAYLRRGQSARRAAFASCAAAAAATVAAAVLVGSLDSLVDHPVRYGFAWDAQVGNFGSTDQLADGLEQLKAVPHITNAAGYIEADALIEGRFAPLLAFGDIDGYRPISVPVTAGRLPQTESEVALGAPLAAAFHKRLGDSVEVSIRTADGDKDVSLTIVGNVVVTALFPAVDPKNGVVVHSSLLTKENRGNLPVAGSLLVGVDPAFRAETAAALASAFPNSYATAVPPLDVRNLQRIAGVPALLAVVIGLLAFASLVHALIVITRSSRHDLTVLRVLGASRRQARSSLLWLATALVGPAVIAGAVVGLIGGQVGWRSIAKGRALEQAPVIPAAWIVAGLVVANLAAWLPARRSANASPAAVLRTE